MHDKMTDEQRAWMESLNGQTDRHGFVKVPITWQNFKFMRAALEGALVHNTHGSFRAVICSDECCVSVIGLHPHDESAANISLIIGGPEVALDYLQAVSERTYVTGMN